MPLPTELISLGLIEYVAHVRALGATVLFPHRKANATRAADPSKHVSRVFGQHLTDVGIVNPGKVFHSFRHTVITRMHVNRVPVGDAELIVGTQRKRCMNGWVRLGDAVPASAHRPTSAPTSMRPAARVLASS